MPNPDCSSRISPCYRHWQFLLVGALLATLSGCIVVPVKMPPLVQGPSGASADHTFIQEGQTTRKEVLDRLGWADVGLKEQRILWARWAGSSSGSAFISFVLPKGVGVDKERVWTVRNLLIEFDENDTVSRVVPDVKAEDLIREFVDWSGRSNYRGPSLASIDHDVAAFTDGWRPKHGLLVVNADSIEILDNKSPTRFKIPHDKIKSLTVEFKRGSVVQPRYKLKLKQGTPWGRTIRLGITAPQVIPLLQYLAPKKP